MDNGNNGYRDDSTTVDYIELQGDHSANKAWDGRKAQLPAPGTYNFKITKSLFDSSKKGTPMMVLTLEIADDGEFKGRSLKHYFTIDESKPGNIGRLQNLYNAAGVPWGKRIVAAQFVGRYIKAEVYADTYQRVDDRTGETVDMPSVKVYGETVSDFANDDLTASAAPANTATTATAPRRQVAKPPVGANAGAVKR